MRVEKVAAGFYMATQKIKDGGGHVIRVECACLPDRMEAMKQCFKQCKENGAAK